MNFELNPNFYLVLADTRIIRGCGWDDSNHKNKCYSRSGFGGRQEVCACSEDNCNGAMSLRMQPFFGGIALVWLMAAVGGAATTMMQTLIM